MRARNLVREREDEASVVLDLLRCRLRLEHADRVTEMPESRLLELLSRVVARVIVLGLRRDDLVEQLALPVVLPRFDVRLRHRGRSSTPADGKPC